MTSRLSLCVLTMASSYSLQANAVRGGATGALSRYAPSLRLNLLALQQITGFKVLNSRCKEPYSKCESH